MIAGVLPIVWIDQMVLVLAVGAHALIGAGIGLAHATTSARAFALAPAGTEGAVASDLLIADSFMPAVSIGAGGALVAISDIEGWPAAFAIGGALLINVLLITLAFVAAYRLPHQSRVKAARSVEARSGTRRAMFLKTRVEHRPNAAAQTPAAPQRRSARQTRARSS